MDVTAEQGRPAGSLTRVWGKGIQVSSREHLEVFQVSREPKYVVSKARSFLGCLRLPGTSGVDLSLLLDGWFINDSLVVTFFALLPFEEPNRHCQNNGDPKDTSQGH